MSNEEARKILLTFRPGTDDPLDPPVAEALAKAAAEPELGGWLAENSARHQVLGGKFRSIAVPAGLKEQIVSEAAAARRPFFKARKPVVISGTVLALALCVVAVFLYSLHMDEFRLPAYQGEMAGIARFGYTMNLVTNSMEAVLSHLRANGSPADLRLPEALGKAKIIGCSVQTWQGAKVSLICLKTGRPLPPGQQNDLWLFAVDRESIRDPGDLSQPRFAAIGTLSTATWVREDKLYFLGLLGDEETLRKYL